MGSFYFKKFSVKQESSAMKVNTDGVLLPAWASLSTLKEGCSILDVGCGTGIIALIVAERLSAQLKSFSIIGIDIDKSSAEESSYNFENSPWSSHLSALHISLQNFRQGQMAEGSFDMILSNPPYFANSLKSPGQRRTIARHNDSLPISQLLNSTFFLLKEGGVLALILPIIEGDLLIDRIKTIPGFNIRRVCQLKTIEGKLPKRYMIELVKNWNSISNSTITNYDSLVMQSKEGNFTNQYLSLVGDFYL